MPEDLPPPSECANCGARIPPGAKACPECGADERTGWREASVYDGLELPASAYEDETDADEKTAMERNVNGIAWYWWVVAAALLALILFGWVL